MQEAIMLREEIPESHEELRNQDEKVAGKRKVKRIAVISEWCTGCGGSPVCLVYCKFSALQLVADPENYPFQRMTVNRDLCVGCGACVSGGKDGLMLTGCPWNAISLMTRR